MTHEALKAPLDPARSPHTGLTRAHWVELADRTTRGIRPFATSGHALVHLPGPVSGSGRRSDGLEGFAHTFLTSTFRTLIWDSLSDRERQRVVHWLQGAVGRSTRAAPSPTATPCR